MTYNNNGLYTSWVSWKRLPLGDIAKVRNGYAFKSKKFSDEGNPVIKIKNVNGRVVNKNDCQLYPVVLCEKLDKFKLYNNDILIAMTGAGSVGRVSKFMNENMDVEYYLNQRVGKIIPDSNRLDNEFLYQIISSERYEKILFDSASGSGQPNLSPTIIGNIEIPVPPLQEQKAIADILSSLDNKIELNNKINENLEQQAQAIFKHWFVDFEFPDKNANPYKSSGGEMVESELGMIPKGWEVNPLDNFMDRIDNRGKTPPYEKEKTEFPLLDVGTLRGESRIVDYNKVSKYVSEETYKNWFRNGHPKNNDILISTVGSLAEMKLFIGDVGCIAQNVVAMRTDNISPFYLYEYLKFIKNDLISYDIGTVQPSIKITHIIKHPLILPGKDILNNFHNMAEKITSKIYNNNLENQRLSQLRDTLLPKLMSGELRIPLD